MLTSNTTYLDYQASTPLHESAMKMMLPYYHKEFANPHSSDHILGWKSNQAAQAARAKIANAICADEDEVIFTSGATESNNLAIKGLQYFLLSQNKTKIITSSIEHKCILMSAEFMGENGFEVIYLQPNSEGIILPEKLNAAIDDKVGLVSIMLVNNEIGTIQPVAALCNIAKKRGALFHTDAAQAPVFTKIDVNELGVDLLSLSSHKAYGPKGIGALYMRREIQEDIKPILHGGGQENGLRSGTLPTALCVGFGEAFHQLSSTSKSNANKLGALSSIFLSGLKKLIPEIEVNGSLEKRHPGNLSVRFPGYKAQDFLQALQPTISASSGSACNSGMEEPSYVLDAIGKSYSDASESIRFSFGIDQTSEEVVEASIFIGRAYNDYIISSKLGV